ncbi:hypothetical protein PISMIDRAFT_13939 [Pisolithus microcarpus 441]|uniref:Uncharacterized protein n=1 Tax=Pisolithus microcarpus 441 TaxID=765257 RepID=A0A0C9YYT9_9AGAM|nr:hypothetical protein PISMIDRAFT_13939 [Pisolithus microcarpus 441]
MPHPFELLRWPLFVEHPGPALMVTGHPRRLQVVHNSDFLVVLQRYAMSFFHLLLAEDNGDVAMGFFQRVDIDIDGFI